jgi:prepilin-type N-terminal cleavage/methylation domain-containing protein
MRNRGFTVLELLIVLAIMTILVALIVTALVKSRKSQGIDQDTETVVETLRMARDQTLSSDNASQYGVHFASSTATLFTGTTYSSGSSSNVVFTFTTSDLVMGLSLAGGGSDVIFQRLSGQTADSGTITISSPSSGFSRVVTVYNTGIIQVPNL